MNKPVTVLIGIAVLSGPAFGQVRPQDCRPIFPVMDKLAEAAPLPDVIAERAPPIATAARKGFFGLPLLLPLLAGAGGVAVLASDDDDDGGSVGEPVSPA